MLSCQLALAQSESPEIGVEASASASSQLAFADLFVPLESELLGGRLVPHLVAVQDSRPGMGSLGTGLAYESFARRGNPEWLVQGMRYTAFDLGERSGALWELSGGVALYDLPPRLSHSDNETFIGVRWRHYLSRNILLPLLGRTYRLPSGLSFDLLLPVEAGAGWQSANRTWEISTGLRFRDRQYPWRGKDSGWLVGDTTELYLGLARQLAGGCYLTLETGLQSESLELTSARGESSTPFSSSFGPWVKVAVQLRQAPTEARVADR